jgi:26S proteasome regulatory subunit T3
VNRPDKISSAEIAAICSEAGLHAVRANRYVVVPKDFEEGYKKHTSKAEKEFQFYS